jgi:hypothetical protein
MYIYPAQYRRYVLDCPLAGGHIYILNTSFGCKLGAQNKILLEAKVNLINSSMKSLGQGCDTLRYKIR